MNSFDPVVALGLVFAVVTGFTTGLLHRAVTILADLVAMPIAGAMLSIVRPGIAALPANRVLLSGLFLVIGVVLGKLARTMPDDAVGSEMRERRI
jgi:membrane protein required for colicin V production